MSESTNTSKLNLIKKELYLSTPDDWIRTTLGESFVWGSGGTPKRTQSEYYEGGNIPWLVIGDLNDRIVTDSHTKITEKGLENSAAKVVQPGSLLLAMYGSIGKLGIAGVPLTTNQAIAFAKPNKNIDIKYLFYFIFLMRQKLAELGKGATQINISQTVIKSFPFVHPSITKQCQIIVKIEELFSELDSGIASLKTAQEQLKFYRQSLLKHAFEGKLTEQWRKDNANKLETPEQLLTRIQTERETRYQQQFEEWKQAVKDWEIKGKEGKKPSKPRKYKPAVLSDGVIESLPSIPNRWRWVSFSELLFSIRGGTTVPPIDMPTSLPILRSSSIRAGRLNLKDIRYLPENSKISSEDYLKPSDLLFSRLNGTLEFVGVCASMPSIFPKNLLYPDRFYCAKLIYPEMAKLYECYFSSPLVRQGIEKKAKSTAGHKRISIPDISEQPIPIFDNNEAKKIIDLLSEKLSIIEQNKKEIESALAKAELLRQSILKKAFSGRFS